MNKDLESTVDVVEDEEIVTLTYDDGSTQSFYNLAELDYEGKWYAYLEPMETGDEFEEGEVVIYEIGEDENGEEMFLPVESDELLDILIELLNDNLFEDSD